MIRQSQILRQPHSDSGPDDHSQPGSKKKAQVAPNQPLVDAAQEAAESAKRTVGSFLEEDFKDMKGLEGRLVDWMKRVDKRLDTLLAVHRCDEGAGMSIGRKDCGDLRERKRRSSRRQSPDAEKKHQHKDLEEASTSGLSMQISGESRPIAQVLTDVEKTLSQNIVTKQKLDQQADHQRRLSMHQREKERLATIRESPLNKAGMQKEEAAAQAQTRRGWSVESIILSDRFDYVISTILVVNALLIGVEVQWDASGLEPHLALQVVEWICGSVFTLELLLRIVGRGGKFCAPGERFWAVCDTVLVVLFFVDLFIGFIGGDEAATTVVEMGSSGRLLKIIRMFRILRLLRMVRFLSELRVMAHMITNSMVSLFWLFSLLAILIYVFAIVLTQGATEHLKVSRDPEIDKLFGSLFTTMYTLFQAMSGGVSWGEMTTPLQKVGWVYFVISLVYIFFCIFSVLNIVTGVFVDGAIELAKQDRSMIVAKQERSREACAAELLDLLKEMDINGDRILDRAEFYASLSNEEVVQYMDALSVDVSEAEMLFTLLDKDGDGSVGIEEFIDGMQRLKGEAKSFDIHMLIHANRQVLRVCSDVIGRFEGIKSGLSNIADSPPDF